MRYYKILYIYICFVLVAVSFFPLFARAHVMGNSLEQVYGQYKIDIGYEPATFIQDEPIRLDFNVTTEAGGEVVAFTDVWVRVVQSNKTVFASGIHKPVLGKTGMTFTFPEGGSYTLSVRFQNSGQTIVEATFPVNVEPSVQEVALTNNISKLRKLGWAGWTLAGISIMGSMALVLRSRKRIFAKKSM